MFVCSCLIAGLTAAPINLKFCMHTLIRRDCAIGYMIFTFEVIKGHFRSNNFLWQVPLQSRLRCKDFEAMAEQSRLRRKDFEAIAEAIALIFENPGAVALLFENPGAVALL